MGLSHTDKRLRQLEELLRADDVDFHFTVVPRYEIWLAKLFGKKLVLGAITFYSWRETWYLTNISEEELRA